MQRQHRHRPPGSQQSLPLQSNEDELVILVLGGNERSGEQRQKQRA